MKAYAENSLFVCLFIQFVSVVQGLIKASRQLRQLHFDHKDSDMELDDVHPKSVKSSLMRRLVAAASSVSVSEPAAQLLSSLDTDAAASGDKLKLFHCRDGKFPEVSLSLCSDFMCNKLLDFLVESCQYRN